MLLTFMRSYFITYSFITHINYLLLKQNEMKKRKPPKTKANRHFYFLSWQIHAVWGFRIYIRFPNACTNLWRWRQWQRATAKKKHEFSQRNFMIDQSSIPINKVFAKSIEPPIQFNSKCKCRSRFLFHIIFVFDVFIEGIQWEMSR